MGINVMLHPVLSNGVETSLDVEGNTVGECMECIIEHYPDIREKIFASADKLKYYVEILVNGQSTFPQELLYPVQDGDSIAILVLIAGR